MAQVTAQGPVETPEPKPNGASGDGSGYKLPGKAIGRVVAGALLLAVLPLLAASETSIKDLVSGWFQDCKLIIEKGPVQFLKNGLDAVVPVTIYAAGNTALPEIRFAFSTETEAIEKVTLNRDLETGNLAIHPSAGEACPGKLCKDPDSVPDPKQAMECKQAVKCHRDISVTLSGFRTVFDYPFTVYISSKEKLAVAADSLSVYVFYEKNMVEAKKTVCAAEEATIFNLYSRVGAGSKFGILTLFLISLSCLVALLRKWSAS